MTRPCGYKRPKKKRPAGNKVRAAELRRSLSALPLADGEHVIGSWCSDCTPCGCETHVYLNIPCTSIATTTGARQRQHGLGGGLRPLPELRGAVDVHQLQERSVHGPGAGK